MKAGGDYEAGRRGRIVQIAQSYPTIPLSSYLVSVFSAGEESRGELMPFLWVLLCDIIDNDCKPSEDAAVDADFKRLIGETELYMIVLAGGLSAARSAR